jgi:hypothetical protein
MAPPLRPRDMPRGLTGSGTEPSPGPAATEQVDERGLMIELRSPRTERFANVAEMADFVAGAK